MYNSITICVTIYAPGPRTSRITSWKFCDPCLSAQYARIRNAPVINTSKLCKIQIDEFMEDWVKSLTMAVALKTAPH